MAKYIKRNNEIIQEFYFASPRTKILINEKFNMSWYGSSIWDIKSEYFLKIESCYNRSIKLMADLPYSTHKYLIETITKKDHLRKIIWKRFIKFFISLNKMSKPIIKTLIDVSSNSSKSITGRNLRGLRLETNIFDEDIDLYFASFIEYYNVSEDNIWKCEILDQLLSDMDEGELEEDDREWIEFCCTN